MKSVIYQIFEILLYVAGASLAGTTSPFDNIELDEGPSSSSIVSLIVKGLNPGESMLWFE